MRPNRARLILEVSTSVHGEPPIRFRHLWIKTHPPENVELCCHEALLFPALSATNQLINISVVPLEFLTGVVGVVENCKCIKS